MQIEIISVDKVRQKFVLEGEREYLTRIKPYASVRLTELRGKRPSALGLQARIEAEAKALSAAVRPRCLLVVLDQAGKVLSSRNFAAWLARETGRGKSDFCFAIGGPYGWASSVKERADQILSLSAMTFSYQMTRLILVEQIYRALTIINGAPYHK